MAKVKVQPIKRMRIRFGIRSTTPIILHKWSEKAKEQMREKQQTGKKTKKRELRDPETEAIAATYTTKEGEVGIPALAFKTSLLTAAHKDIGIERTMVRKSVFLCCHDPNMVIAFKENAEPTIREDPVRVGAGSADLRYRPEFASWSANVELEIDGELLQVSDVLTLVNRAGFGVGLCEWRPEKGGEYGRFEVDTDTKVECNEW